MCVCVCVSTCWAISHPLELCIEAVYFDPLTSRESSCERGAGPGVGAGVRAGRGQRRVRDRGGRGTGWTRWRAGRGEQSLGRKEEVKQKQLEHHAI